MILGQGIKIEAKFVKGKIETGKYIYPNGAYFGGSFENDRPNGVGFWKLENGTMI